MIQKLTLITLFASACIFAQKKEVKITSEKITDNIYMLKGQGGNIAVLTGSDGTFMIDDQFAPLTPKILTAIKGITNTPVKYLINTHWHGDHTGGNANMQKEGAVIVAHKNVRKRMSVEQFIRGQKRPASPKEALPVITFTDDMMFHINNEDILVTHVHNAHTDGDALVYFMTSNVIHMGDTYFQGKFPFIDLESGGSINGYIKAIEKALLLANNDTKIIPGHRNVSSKKELTNYHKMLVDLKTKVQQAIANGQSIEEVKKNTSLTKQYTNYGDWFISDTQILETIYKSLQK